MTWNYDLSQIRKGRFYTVSWKLKGLQGVERRAWVDGLGKWRYECPPYGSPQEVLGTVYAFIDEALPDPAPLPEDHAQT